MTGSGCDYEKLTKLPGISMLIRYIDHYRFSIATYECSCRDPIHSENRLEYVIYEYDTTDDDLSKFMESLIWKEVTTNVEFYQCSHVSLFTDSFGRLNCYKTFWRPIWQFHHVIGRIRLNFDLLVDCHTYIDNTKDEQLLKRRFKCGKNLLCSRQIESNPFERNNLSPQQ